MSYYGFVVTDDGRELIAKLVAGEQLALTKIMVGSGSIPEGTKPTEMKNLSEPVAAGTSTAPVYDGVNVQMTIEYRSDLNGGLDHGFWLREFGVFAYDPDKGEIMMCYGTLGDYPQYVSALSKTGVDVRRFPVCIVIGEDLDLSVEYKCEAWITLEEMEQYCSVTVLPQFLDKTKELIAQHNGDPEAHPALQNGITGVNARLLLLELMIKSEVTGNPFVVAFDTLEGTSADGVWNEGVQRIEF